MRLKAYAGVLAAVSAVVLTAAGASASPPAAAGWQIVKTIHAADQPQFLSLAVTGRQSAWAFAQTTGKPAAWRMQNGVWSQAPFPDRAGDQVLSAGASGPDNVWAFSSQPTGMGQAMRWDGTRWTVMRQFAQVIWDGLVLGPDDVWVFGQPYYPGNGLGTWHYNGTSWTRSASVPQLVAASALSPRSIWAAGGTTAAHWNGSTWAASSLAGLLPPATTLCHPGVTAVYAQSATSVWVTGEGGCENLGRGPFVLLHFNGSRWSRVILTYQYGQPDQVVPDGSGGLWIPVITGFEPPLFTMLHYSAGHLTAARLPLPASGIRMTVAHVPGTGVTLGAGAFYNTRPILPKEAILLRYAG